MIKLFPLNFQKNTDDFVIDAEANSSELLGLITFNDSIDDDKDDKPEGSHMYLISFLVFLGFVVSSLM